MKIIRIERKQKTEKEDYTLITFKTWWGKEFTETCVTPNWNLGTSYAKNGRRIPYSLWEIVKGFLRTEDDVHEY
ncbi:hypothetical protein [Spongiimicrobium salis]|uniref:hypothetical protein n=1 Tax=Spongiimicrobium salis TaxID=1667022 RepID=UPI00374D82D0